MPVQAAVTQRKTVRGRAPLQICCPLTGVAPGQEMTGAAAYDANILAHLARLGVCVHAILPEGHALPENSGCEGKLAIHRVWIPPGPRPAQHLARLLVFARLVRTLYRQLEFDLLRVHSFFSSTLEALSIKAAGNLPTPVVVHFHHLDDSVFRNQIVGASIRRADAVIAFSQAARGDAIARLGVSPGKIHVVYHGVDRRFRPAEPRTELLRQLGWSPGEHVLLFLGSLEPRKQPLFLLEALQKLLAAQRKVRLIICGNGPLLDNLWRNVRDMGLESDVTFTGMIPEEAKPDYYNLADVFLFPSMLEGFGLVLGEAMSCGKPVVAFHTSAISEVVEHGVAGLLVPPGDLKGFVDNILLLLDQKELRLQLGDRAAQRVERLFRWERAARETLEVYEATVKQFDSRGRDGSF